MHWIGQIVKRSYLMDQKAHKVIYEFFSAFAYMIRAKCIFSWTYFSQGIWNSHLTCLHHNALFQCYYNNHFYKKCDNILQTSVSCGNKMHATFRKRGCRVPLHLKFLRPCILKNFDFVCLDMKQTYQDQNISFNVSGPWMFENSLGKKLYP